MENALEARCAQADTYDDDAWVLLFIFLEVAITATPPADNVAPEALITALQSAATPTGQAVIRQAVAQPYLRDLLKRQAAQRRSTNPCVIV